MGHAGHLRGEYQDLVDRLENGTVGLPMPDSPSAREGWREVLEILYTPEEAELASRLPVRPSGLGAIAARLRVTPDELKPRLDRMCDKGLVMDLVHPETQKTRYVLAPPVIGFFEFSMMRAHDMYPKKRLAKALDAYMHGDPAFAVEVFGADTMIGRAVVHEDLIPPEVLPDVLDWERASSLVHEADMVALSFCYCRHKAEHLGQACGAATEVCMSLNAGAAYVVRRAFGRQVEKEEALDVLTMARETGLVHIADNVQQKPTYVCSCCGCCCGQLRAINEYDLRAVNPSGFVPSHDDDTCSGCSRCSRACPITAISMTAQRVDARPKNELRPRVDPDRCIGCGVCATACPRDAMTMERRASTSYVPQNSMEKTLRQMLERGRLAHLVFDEGAGRGSAFLNQLLQALCKLPVAEQALASEQLRSRFISQALARVPNPTG